MMRGIGAIMVLACGLAASAAMADAGLETVIVNGVRVQMTPDAIAHDVIRSYAAPSVLLGQIPRWNTPLCPRTDGLSSRSLNAYVTQRIREVAALAGAKVAGTACKANLEVVFTADPQITLDSIHAANVDVLGYHGATTISHPVQAWYTTGITDINGKTNVDRDTSGDIEFTNGGGVSYSGHSGKPVEHGMATTVGIPGDRIQGWKGRPELTSDILGVLIIADKNKTGDYKLGPVADYIAMLALVRTEAFESCQITTSITNLMAAGCDSELKPDAIAPGDIGFLRGIYQMDAGATLQVQQDQIAGAMVKALPEGK